MRSKLVIELDGGQHGERARERDAETTMLIEAQRLSRAAILE